MLDKANGGVPPPAEFLRAIRHAVAASACRAAWRSTKDEAWLKTAVEQSEASRARLHQAAFDRSSANSAIARCNRF